MVKTLLSSNLYSHPGITLEKHLVRTAELAVENLANSPVQKVDRFQKKILERLIFACSLCHDLGKATPYFQQYLLATRKEKEKLKQMEETRHGLLSAVASFYTVNRELQEEIPDGDERTFLSFLAFLVVRRHHGNFGYVRDEVVISEKNKELLNKQVQSIDEKKLALLNEHLTKAGLKQPITKIILKGWTRSIINDLRKIRRKLRYLGQEANLNYYLVVNFLFSLLIDSDKSEVVIKENIERKEVPLDSSIVDKYKASLGFKQSTINLIREEAYHEVLNHSIDLNERVLSINLPTGLGKTFTSFAFAFNLRKKIKQKKGFIPRIIYALPFLSVIDQNADDVEKILEFNSAEIDTSLLLKHHHLSEVYYKKDNDEFEPAQAKILIEGWNSEIIITTFIQLFYTLISNKNKSLRKFHRLSGSIIVLDEVQSIPCKYWLLIKEILSLITQELDAYIVFVTATEPLIFERHEVIALVNRQYYFNKMDRVVIEARLEEDLTIEEFTDTLVLQKGKSYLFILNTIKSTKQFYKLLKSKTDEVVDFLSTHVTPFERLERINKMRKGKTRFAVATQLVEAGVDIDFDLVYRDLAPLDSINQAAGRCNRHWVGGGDKGKIIVVSLKDEKRRYSDYIYDRVLLDITRKILKREKEIPENKFLDVIRMYYEELQEKKSSDTSRELIEAVYKMKYDSVDETICIKDFKLISQDYPKIDVFIEINSEAEEVWQKFLHIKEIKSMFERRLAFSKIKADFYKFTISIPATVKNLPPEVAGFRYVSLNSLNDYYDQTTGFKPQGVLSIW